MAAVNLTPNDGADKATINELKEKLVLANLILDHENLAKPLGHISIRVPGTETFLISRDVAPGMVVVEDILICDMNGKVVQGKYPRTFSEVAIHTGIYRKRGDIKSVAHTHSLHIIALSMTETPLLPASFSAIKAGTEPIALFKKTDHIDKRELGEEIADLLGPNKAVILKGHGAVVVGQTIEETIDTAVELEVAAGLQLLASPPVRTLVPFTEQEKRPFIEFRKGSGPVPIGALRRWAYYRSLLKEKVR